MIYDIIVYFPKYLGYYYSETLYITYTKNFENTKFEIEKFILTIFRKDLIIEETSRIILLPKLSYLQYFKGKMYYLTLATTFVGTFLTLDLIIVLMITCISNFSLFGLFGGKPVSHKDNNNGRIKTFTKNPAEYEDIGTQCPFSGNQTKYNNFIDEVEEKNFNNYKRKDNKYEENNNLSGNIEYTYKNRDQKKPKTD